MPIRGKWFVRRNIIEPKYLFECQQPWGHRRWQAEPHQEADERLHGLVSGSEEKDGQRESQNAQLRDFQTLRGGLEAAHGAREEAIHR